LATCRAFSASRAAASSSPGPADLRSRAAATRPHRARCATRQRWSARAAHLRRRRRQA
jgi:hypothetical protein